MKGQRNLFQIGEKYGLLTIAKRWTVKSPHHSSKETYCECDCECGTKGIVLRACYFRDKRKKKFSCGCLTRRGRRNLFKIGDRFGKLVIKNIWSEMRTKKSKETKCECQCDCGSKVIIVPTRYVANGHKKSCGCAQYLNNSNSPNWKGYKGISSSVWTKIKRGAKRRGRIIPFDITIEQAWEIFQKQNGRCVLSGVEIHFPEKSTRYGGDCTASLDRIDSSKGYTIDNVQWVHKIVNLMKMNLPQDVFIKWCKLISSCTKSSG